MKWILISMLAMAGCEGSRQTQCYGNHTCDDGLTCVWLRGHGSMCVADEDVQVFRDRTFQRLLPDGGAR